MAAGTGPRQRIHHHPGPLRRARRVELRRRHRRLGAPQRRLLPHPRPARHQGIRPGHAVVPADHRPAGNRRPGHARQEDRRRAVPARPSQDRTRQHQHAAAVAHRAGDPQQFPAPARWRRHPLPGVLHRTRPRPRARRRPALGTGRQLLPQTQPQHHRRDRRGRPRPRRLPVAERRADPSPAARRQHGQHGRPHRPVLPAPERSPRRTRRPRAAGDHRDPELAQRRQEPLLTHRPAHPRKAAGAGWFTGEGTAPAVEVPRDAGGVGCGATRFCYVRSAATGRTAAAARVCFVAAAKAGPSRSA